MSEDGRRSADSGEASAITTTAASQNATGSTGSSDPPSPSDAAVAAATGAAAAVSTTLTSQHPARPPWPNSADGYEMKEVIGYGATAVVHAAYCKVRDERCAIKRINLEKWNTSMDELLKEIQAMSSCNHENVVTYFTSFVHKEELWLVLRLLDAGSLLDILRYRMKTQDCKHGVLDEAVIATVLKEVLKGLEYLHNTGHIHRDIKAGNILLGTDGQVQIADFGVSAILNGGSCDLNRAKSRHTFVGTPCWMAPEVMEQVTGYDYKADIWSFGITAIELAAGTAPYHKYPPMKVLMLTLQNDPPTLDTSAEDKEQYRQFGRTFRKMVSECLQKDPAKRPTASELLKHQFFKNKAKDRKFLQQSLVTSAPSLDARVQKARANKQKASSGRLHRNDAGDWVWSSEEEDVEDFSSASDASKSGHQHQQQPQQSPSPAAAAAAISHPQSATATNQNTINMVLRMRNPRRELNDIRFEYKPSQDSPQGIASELLATGLIVPQDVQIMGDNLNMLITHPPPSRVLTFRVNTGFDQANDPLDEKNLFGFAQLSLI